MGERRKKKMSQLLPPRPSRWVPSLPRSLAGQRWNGLFSGLALLLLLLLSFSGHPSRCESAIKRETTAQPARPASCEEIYIYEMRGSLLLQWLTGHPFSGDREKKFIFPPPPPLFQLPIRAIPVKKRRERCDHKK